MISTLVPLISILFALIAAALWSASAMVNIPIIGSGYGTIANLEPFYAAMKKVARLNAGAAACSFVAATATILSNPTGPIVSAAFKEVDIYRSSAAAAPTGVKNI